MFVQCTLVYLGKDAMTYAYRRIGDVISLLARYGPGCPDRPVEGGERHEGVTHTLTQCMLRHVLVAMFAMRSTCPPPKDYTGHEADSLLFAREATSVLAPDAEAALAVVHAAREPVVYSEDVNVFMVLEQTPGVAGEPNGFTAVKIALDALGGTLTIFKGATADAVPKAPHGGVVLIKTLDIRDLVGAAEDEARMRAMLHGACVEDGMPEYQRTLVTGGAGVIAGRVSARQHPVGTIETAMVVTAPQRQGVGVSDVCPYAYTEDVCLHWVRPYQAADHESTTFVFVPPTKDTCEPRPDTIVLSEARYRVL
jgi:hypothetical protein